MTYLEFLSLLVLYMAWIVLLLRLIMADEVPLHDGEDHRRSRDGEAEQYGRSPLRY